MPDSFEEIASQPSIIRSHWLPLEAAVQEIVAFEQRFGEAHLLLACHAALPALLTPELLHFIRLNFLDQQDPPTPWISEMDLLLSPLCRPIDDELFEIEPMIREALLFELQEREGWSRLQELSQFLLEYLQKMQPSNPDPARLYEWIAQSYLQPDKVIAELQHILQESLDPQLDARQTLPKKLQLARTIELLAEPLERTTRPSDYHGLIHSARIFSHVLYTNQENIATTPLTSNGPANSKQGAAFFPPAVQQWLQSLTTVQSASEQQVSNVIDAHTRLENVNEEEKKVLHMLETAGWHLQAPAAIDPAAAAYIVVRKAPWSMLPSVDIPLFTSSQGYPTLSKATQGKHTYILIVNAEIVGKVSIKKQNEQDEAEDPRDNTIYNLSQLVFRRNSAPFTYEIEGSDILFTNELEPEAQSRRIAYFHRPETLEAWLQQAPIDTPNNLNDLLRSRLRHMPIMSPKEWRTQAHQWEAATALEKSLADNQPRALIAMPDGTGKTSLLVQMAYRLLTFANARRILYLTNENNQQSIYARFERFRIPGTTEHFTERFHTLVSHNSFASDTKIWIMNIDRLYPSMVMATHRWIKDSIVVNDYVRDRLEALPVKYGNIPSDTSILAEDTYSAAIPIEAFDFILIDDYNSTTYARWQPVLNYFDAFIIGTSSYADGQALSFFNHNLVYDYKITSPKGKAQWQVLIKPAFLQAMAKLLAPDARLVMDKITLLTQDPLPDGNQKKQLNSFPGKPYRLRAGNYRIFYNFTQQYIVLFKIERRGDTTYQDSMLAENGFDAIEPTSFADRLWSYSEIWAPSELKTQWLPLLKQAFWQDVVKLPAKDLRLVVDKLTLLMQNPYPDGKQKIQLNHLSDNLYRMRAGNYRIFYTFNQQYILLFKIEQRDTTYPISIKAGDVPDSAELDALADQLQTYDGVIGHEGVYLGDYLAQLTYLIFLKIEQERSYISGKRSAHVPIGYDWQSLLNKSGSALTEHYINILAALSLTQGITGVIFTDADNTFRNPAPLHKLINDYINEETWLSMDSQTRGAIYSRLLVNMSQGKDGPYNNVPDALASTIVEVMHPQPGMTIGDPTCATASLLVEAHTHMIRQTSDPDRLQNTLYGYDISTQIASLAAMHLWMYDCIADDNSSPIIVKDSLRTPPDRQFDMVLSRLPYRVTHLERPLKRADFVAQTSNIQLNFLQHIVSMLNEHGHAAVIVLDETLLEGGTGKQIRADLLETCTVHTLLRLPIGTFYTPANVLFFDSRPHEKGDYETPNSELWVYDLRTNMDLRNIPLTREHFADFVHCYHSQNRQQRTETQRFHKFSYAELIKRKNVNLDISWLLEDITPSTNPTIRNPARTFNRKFNTWLAEQQSARELPFTDEQISWLKRIRDHIITHRQFTLLDLERTPFKPDGGQATAHAIFGPELPALLDELNQLLA